MAVTTTYAAGEFCCPGFCSGDAQAAKIFYQSLMGWEPVELKMPGGSYTMFRLGGHPAGISGSASGFKILQGAVS